MCDAHDDIDSETPAQLEARRRERALDGFADCDAHARSQNEADAICMSQGHVPDGNGRCICCGK